MPQAIAAGHEVTLSVAKEILLAKGNAFDAAIAAHFAMFITEPCMASAGGNGFALTRTENGEIKFLDFFCQTPQKKTVKDHLDFYPIYVDFGDDIEKFYLGLASCAVPGSIAGLFALHRMHGTMPMKELISPAIKLARNGVVLNEFQALDIKLLKRIFQQDESVRDIFFKDGNVKKEGDNLTMPGMADFLEYIQIEGERGFYQGEIAKNVCEASVEKGGFICREDFENYKVNILDPLKVNYKNKHIYLPNGPSKGGAMLAMALAQFTDGYESFPQAIKTTQKIIQREQEIKAHLTRYYPENNFQLQPSVSANRGTSHFNILDRWGNAVSLTSSIGEGCGYFIPGTNMQLNNMLGEVFLLPNGAHSWEPNTRMHSMMTPTMITDKNQNLEFVAGSGGANRIPYSIAQVIYQLYNKSVNLKESTDHPRVHFQDGKFNVELGFEIDLPNEETNYWNSKSLYFGGVHSIFQKDGIVEAVGDDRRFGVAEVF